MCVPWFEQKNDCSISLKKIDMETEINGYLAHGPRIMLYIITSALSISKTRKIA